MSIRIHPHPRLTAAFVRRRPLLLPPPAARAPRRVEPAAGGGWADDLRFFATCYVAGVIFFLIMLS